MERNISLIGFGIIALLGLGISQTIVSSVDVASLKNADIDQTAAIDELAAKIDTATGPIKLPADCFLLAPEGSGANGKPLVAQFICAGGTPKQGIAPLIFQAAQPAPAPPKPKK